MFHFFLFFFYTSACVFSFVPTANLFFFFFLEPPISYKYECFMILDFFLSIAIALYSFLFYLWATPQTFATNYPLKSINCSAKVPCLG